MHDAVGVDVEGDFDLRDAAGRGCDARQHESAQRLVVAAELTLALQNVDLDARLIVGSRREHLALLDGDGRISVDEPREHAAQRLDAEGKGHDVEKEHILDLARQHAALDGSADGDALVGVDALEGLLARDLLDLFDDGGHTGGTADQDDLIEIVVGKPRILHRKAHGFCGLVDEVGNERFELLAGDVHLEVRGARVRHGDEGQRDGGRSHAGKFDLRLLGSFLESLHRHLIFGKIDAVALLELVDHVVHEALIEVVAAQTVVAVGRKHFEDAVGNFEDGDIEGTAAEVVDHDLAVFLLLIEAVGKRRRRGLVDDTKHVEARDLARVLGRLTLGVGEVCGAGDDGVRHLRAEVCLCIRFELAQDHCGNFLRGICLVVNLHLVVGAHLTLDGDDRTVGVCNGLTLCDLTDDTGAVLLEGDNGRRGARTFRIGDHDGLAALHDCNTRIGSTKIDTDNFRHNCSLLFSL